jgi:hypothetical protein
MPGGGTAPCSGAIDAGLVAMNSSAAGDEQQAARPRMAS